ncbi:MAG: carbohydrate ABC transporter permease [Clostridia bacterium]|nr:carbohydrate ABC transporter permease [Clostridia bacterium]
MNVERAISRKNSRLRRKTAYDYINTVLLVALAAIGISPFLHLIAVAFSSGNMTSQYLVSLWPREFSTEAFKEVFADNKMLVASWVSVKRVFLGTVITMALTILTAYPVSLPDREFKPRKFYVTFMMITMMFGGGLIPCYILNSRLHLVNSIWVLVVPGAIPIYNVIVILNFFRNIPSSIREAAMIDGANDFKMLLRIYVPLSVPCFATLITFCVIGHWNAWFDGMLYMREADLYPLQTYLQAKISSISNIKSQQKVEQMMLVSDRSLMYAYIALACIPIMLVFPVLSKYIKNGLILGSVKE